MRCLFCSYCGSCGLLNKTDTSCLVSIAGNMVLNNDAVQQTRGFGQMTSDSPHQQPSVRFNDEMMQGV